MSLDSVMAAVLFISFEALLLYFGKSVADNSFGMFTPFLQYKLTDLGKQFVKINKFFAGSQICNVCGHKNPYTKNLSAREQDCLKWTIDKKVDSK